MSFSRGGNRRHRDCARLFSALGDQSRLAIVEKLADGSSHSISELAEGAAVTRQALSKHLRVLEEVGLVRGRRTGRENRFHLVPEPLNEAMKSLSLISAQWDDALQRLKNFVEE